MAPRTPLRHPKRYFEERGFRFDPAVFALAGSLAVVALALVGFGLLLAAKLSAAGHGDVTSELWGALVGQLVGLVFLTALGWLILTAIIHVVARAALSHDGRFGATLTITAWGFVPTVVPTVVGFAALLFTLSNVTVSTPAAFLADFEQAFADTLPIRIAVGFLATGWQAYIYTHGLAVEFDASTESAGLLAVVVAYSFWLLGLI